MNPKCLFEQEVTTSPYFIGELILLSLLLRRCLLQCAVLGQKKAT